jgi:hypothetical protein
MPADLRHLVTESCVPAASFRFARDDQAAAAALLNRFARRLSRNSAPSWYLTVPSCPSFSLLAPQKLVLPAHPKPYTETASAIQSP